jgi:hypothetical protein
VDQFLKGNKVKTRKMKEDKSGEKKPREPYKFVPVDTPDDVLRDIDEIRDPESRRQGSGTEPSPRFERIADIMKEFHRGTWWETQNGQMVELAIEDTHAKITNYYVVHDRAWTHGAVVDFVDMDEGTGKYTVYALCTDGTVLAVPEEELDEPAVITFEGQSFQMVHHLPKEVEDTAELGKRILREKDRVWEEYEKQKKGKK